LSTASLRTWKGSGSRVAFPSGFDMTTSSGAW
jgi:hypothetical protein